MILVHLEKKREREQEREGVKAHPFPSTTRWGTSERNNSAVKIQPRMESWTLTEKLRVNGEIGGNGVKGGKLFGHLYTTSSNFCILMELFSTLTHLEQKKFRTSI